MEIKYVSCECGTPLALAEYDIFFCPTCNIYYRVDLSKIADKEDE